MKSQTLTTKTLTLIAIFAAIQIVLSLTPLGFIPLGFTRATTVHIPVILGAIILGPKAGMILGFIFGITSIAINTFQPTITSYVFTPFYEGGNLWSIVIAIVPRICIALVAYITFIVLKNLFKKQELGLVLAGVFGSLTNTILVMSGIYIFFGQPYAMAKETTLDKLHLIIGSIIAMNGIPEAIIAGVLTLFIGKVLLRFQQKK